jgi:hypothetical protein
MRHATIFCHSECRTRGGEKLELHDDGITYTVWISFAEIYNENIYDLFQKVPEVGARAVHPDSLNPDTGSSILSESGSNPDLGV